MNAVSTRPATQGEIKSTLIQHIVEGNSSEIIKMSRAMGGNTVPPKWPIDNDHATWEVLSAVQYMFDMLTLPFGEG